MFQFLPYLCTDILLFCFVLFWGCCFFGHLNIFSQCSFKYERERERERSQCLFVSERDWKKMELIDRSNTLYVIVNAFFLCFCGVGMLWTNGKLSLFRI